MSDAQVILELRDIVKTFPGARALDRARLDLRRGEVHALVGENGAGKSTLMNVIAGVLQPDAGQIILDGAPIVLGNPQRAAQHGIAVVFQELSLAPNLSIAENIFANRQPVNRLSFIDATKLADQARGYLKLFDLNVPPGTLVKDLSVAQRQVVEILKAFSHQARVMILDEPTSSLTADQTRRLFENVRRLKQQGVSFIYISHHLAEVFEIADRVTVMRDGRYVDTIDAAGVTEDLIVRKMVGRELSNVYGRRQSPIGDEYFKVDSAGRGRVFDDISFNLRRGEILGVAGLVGAGRTELGRAICGVEPLDRGRMTLDGVDVSIRSPRQAIRRGIVYLTEDRKEHGLFLRMPIRDNCIAPRLRSFASPIGWMRDGRAAEYAESIRQRFRIASPSTRHLVGNLSGGNQQKVLLATWMGVEPRVLIVDEPTRGVDVGARSEIYSLLRDLAARGVGILMISSDLQEILGLSDRILVLRKGRLAAELSRDDATEERIIAAAYAEIR